MQSSHYAQASQSPLTSRVNPQTLPITKHYFGWVVYSFVIYSVIRIWRDTSSQDVLEIGKLT